jgi:hypothetical protein
MSASGSLKIVIRLMMQVGLSLLPTYMGQSPIFHNAPDLIFTSTEHLFGFDTNWCDQGKEDDFTKQLRTKSTQNLSFLKCMHVLVFARITWQQSVPTVDGELDLDVLIFTHSKFNILLPNVRPLQMEI